MDLLVTPDLQLDVITGCPPKEKLETCIDPGNPSVSFQVDRTEDWIPLDYERSGGKGNLRETNSDEFTSSKASEDWGTEDQSDRLANSEEDILNFEWDGLDSGFVKDDFRDCGDESRPVYCTSTGKWKKNIANESLEEEISLMGVKKDLFAIKLEQKEKRRPKIQEQLESSSSSSNQERFRDIFLVKSHCMGCARLASSRYSHKRRL